MKTPTLAGAGVPGDQGALTSNHGPDRATNCVIAQAHGATPGAWLHCCEWLDLDACLLPVVSDPSIPISPRSGITGKTRSKAPSIVNSSGTLAGIPGWSTHRSTDLELTRWAKDDRLGICLRLERMGALDIDIEDSAAATAVRAEVERVLGFPLPARSRENSGRMALVFRHVAPILKQVHETPHGKIELLGDGQQFVMDGRHKSGERYQWDGEGPAGLPYQIPHVTPEQLNAVLAVLGFEKKTPRAEHEPQGLVEPLTDAQTADLRSALRHIADAGLDDDYHGWAEKSGSALKSLGDAIGLPLFIEHSANCGNGKPRRRRGKVASAARGPHRLRCDIQARGRCWMEQPTGSGSEHGRRPARCSCRPRCPARLHPAQGRRDSGDDQQLTVGLSTARRLRPAARPRPIQR